jgi:stage V sporulation protein S
MGNPGNDANKSKLIIVTARSRCTAVAGEIALVIREQCNAVVQAMGRDAVHQAVKAIAIARLYLKDQEIDIVFVPELLHRDIDAQPIIQLSIMASPLRPGVPNTLSQLVSQLIAT